MHHLQTNLDIHKDSVPRCQNLWMMESRQRHLNRTSGFPQKCKFNASHRWSAGRSHMATLCLRAPSECGQRTPGLGTLTESHSWIQNPGMKRSDLYWPCSSRGDTLGVICGLATLQNQGVGVALSWMRTVLSRVHGQMQKLTNTQIWHSYAL